MRVVFCFHTTDNEFNIGIGFISAALIPLGVSTELVTFREIPELPTDSVTDIVERILEKKPDIVAFSVMTFNWHRIRKVIEQLRPAFQGWIVVGGCHAILRPEEVLACPEVDWVCPGEGEQPMRDLVRHYQQDPSNRSPSIQGLYSRTVNSVRDMRPWLKQRLEAYPYADWELFIREGGRPLRQKRLGSYHPTGLFAMAAITSRGCPYRCAYCNNHSFMKRYGGVKHYLRYYPVDHVIGCLKEMADQYHPEFIEFFDEMFISNRDRVRKFSQAYDRHVGVPYGANVRIDLCTEEVVRPLAQSGLKSVLMGVECGNEAYRRTYLNRHMTNKDILKGAEILKAHGVTLITLSMFGLPMETPQMMSETIALNRAIAPDAVSAFIFQPLPGTPLGDLAFAKNLVMPPPQGHWDYLSPALDSPELPATMVAETVNRFRSEFNSPEKLSQCFNTLRERVFAHLKSRRGG